MASKSYELLRPVAYYGLVPLALYLGMQGDVAPRSVRGYNIGTYMHRSWVILPGFTFRRGRGVSGWEGKNVDILACPCAALARARQGHPHSGKHEQVTRCMRIDAWLCWHCVCVCVPDSWSELPRILIAVL